MKYFIFLFFLAQLYCFGQSGVSSTSLLSLSPDAETNDLSALDSLFMNRKIIGVGESTHGTSEFTIMRHRLFRYLVENHDYNTFFLEADVGACRRINRYIHGEPDSILPAVTEIRLWPWLTTEMTELVEWMKEYNSNEQNNNKIEFVGCDMQLLKDDGIELSRIYTRNSDSLLNDKLPEFDIDPSDTLALITSFSEWNEFKLMTKSLNSRIDSLLRQSIDQWFERELTTSYRGNFRDSCMAVNMIAYLNAKPNAKGFYFAHNWHISKTNRINKYNLPNTKSAGRYLFEELNDEYFCIAQDLNKGSFNAITYVDGEHEMEIFQLKPSKRKSIAYQVIKNKSHSQFVRSEQIPNIDKLLMTFIGAIYGKSESGYKISRYRPLANGVATYDAFIVINETTPTNLLKKD
ncbi:MAG: hypothetical protein COA38_11205 [Fluviicola sp.]|nr:MAG: hypothetical protein COA38_11205 [Fluviicola sp.]